MSTTPTLDKLLAAATRRLRLADATWALGRIALPSALVIAAAVIVAMRRFGAPEAALWLSAAPLPIVLAWAAFRPHSPRRIARRIDAHFGLDDQLGAALELGKSPPRGANGDPRTNAIVDLVRQRGDALAQTIDVAPAFRITVPSPRAHDVFALVLVGVALQIPPARAQLAEASLGGVLLADAQAASARAGLDLALAGPLRQSLKELAGAKDEPALAAQEILEILDALERGEIDRALALEQLEQLEKVLDEQSEKLDDELREDPAMLAEALEELGAGLQEEEVTSKAGEALDKGEGEKAEQALAEAGKEADANAEADEQMKRALADAEKRLGKKNDERESSETAKQLEEEERRLKKEEQKKPQTPEEQAEQERRLKQQKDKVEQLRRQHEREMAAQKKIEELRRNAKQAAQNKAGSAERKRELEKLGRGMKEASRSAQQSQRMQGAQDALEEAKTFVRRSGQSGAGEDKRKQQFRRFDKAAKGEGKEQGKDGKGKDGKGKGKGSTLLVEGEVGDGEPKAMMEGEGKDGQGEGNRGEGQGQQGEGQGEGEGEQGEGEGQGEGQGEGEGQGQNQSASNGDGIGDGTQDPLGDPSAMKSHAKDVRVDVKRGSGVSKAEILKDASQNGFATEPYRKTYEKYRDHAKSALDSDAFPAAQRRLVKRYYQMIQGR